MADPDCAEVGIAEKFGFTEGEETEINHDCYLQKSFHKDSICLPLYAIMSTINHLQTREICTETLRVQQLCQTEHPMTKPL